MYWLILAIIVAPVWLIGIVRNWRLQSLSRPTVSVTVLDRVIAIFWLPIYILTIAFVILSCIVTGNYRSR